MKTVREWLGEAGIVTSLRKLKDAGRYERMFPRTPGKTTTVKRNAGVKHTVKFIPLVVFDTLNHTAEIAQYLIRPSLEQTCRNIWQWVYDHIAYEKDETGIEQVRSPARTFWDRKGDCDCLTTFIDSVLTNVKHITRWKFAVVNRIAKYKKDYFQHIYPIVVAPGGKEIVIDCVTEYFDYEEPYSEKKDYPIMDLQYLNGIDSSFDDEQFDEEEEQFENFNQQKPVGELGKLKILQKVGKKVGTAIKKVVHVTNRVNPATVLLRNGVLASMKLNLFNVAGRIKWTYLNADQAKKKGLNMDRWAKAVKVRERLEKIFYEAGGKQENLKNAILTGKGNKGKEVSGFGLLPIYAMEETGLGVREIIGSEIYDSENSLTGLGEPITAATIAAASAAIATLAQLLKQIGPIKDGGTNSENPDDPGDSISTSDVPIPPVSDGANDNSPSDTNASDNSSSKESADPSNSDTTDNSNTTNADSNTGDGDAGGDKGTPIKFMDDPVGWAKANPATAAFSALLTAAILYGGYKYMTKGKEEPKEEKKQLSGNSSRTTRKSSHKQIGGREQVFHLPLAE